MPTTRSTHIRSIRPTDRSGDAAPRSSLLSAALVLAAGVAIAALEATTPAPRGSGIKPIYTLTTCWPKVTGTAMTVVSGEVFIKLPAGAAGQ